MDGLTLLVPSSVVREAEDKREATRKLGYVARAAAVFRADRLIVFPDREGERRWGEEFVRVVLQYAATPPYLKDEVWGRRDELQFAGILPPLRVSSQTVADPDGSVTHQGIVTKVGSEGRVRVTCGLQHPISLMVPPEMATPTEGERVTVRISSREPVRARLVDEPTAGFDVECTDLSAALSDESRLRIAASEYGEQLSHARLGELLPDLRAGMTVAFGSPGRGLPEILGVEPEAVSAAVAADEHVESDPGFDRWLNTIPRQGSETVRTEEAMFASLGCLTLTE
ncbi:RNA methyltransferase [Halohasta litorea]|uniref:RNA methyltransferase n=1 Tax=Halohasta litorea TaxID=869891 RepID=A0ABD6DC89_9EURY|nr:RNA methyltransferase [Halohasta litorea]